MSADPVPRLDAPGVSEAQAHAIWHVVAEARAGRFDVLAAEVELVEAGFTPSEAAVLVQEVLERAAEGQPDTT